MAFELIFSLSAKFKYNSLKKADKVLDYGIYVLSLGIIEYLII